MSHLLGAAGGHPPAMFPVASALLAEGPQLGPWQVAVMCGSMRPLQGILPDKILLVLHRTGIGRWIYIYELPDSLAHTVVEGGPVGPEVKEPFALLDLYYTSITFPRLYSFKSIPLHSQSAIHFQNIDTNKILFCNTSRAPYDVEPSRFFNYTYSIIIYNILHMFIVYITYTLLHTSHT